MNDLDLRAAVQAGIVNEAQAASLKALFDEREGRRSAMPNEDEPFEFFRGFSEIFISIGLIILLAGVSGLVGWLGGPASAIFLPLVAAAVAWWWALYFTRKRRMNLPSMLLAITFGFGIFISVMVFMTRGASAPDRSLVLLPFVVATAAMALWYRFFRLPFSMFLLGGFALGALYSAVASPEALRPMFFGQNGADAVFDLNQSPVFALATLAFGIVAFLAGLWFDMKDPHRLGRYSATAFWLHLLAAPALVNTVALTLYNSGGSAGMPLLALALVIITILALVIDRRSFLSAAIAYIGTVLVWLVGDDSAGGFVFIILVLGALITAIGTWWVQLRAFVMRRLPDFPGKDRLPPYSRPE